MAGIPPPPPWGAPEARLVDYTVTATSIVPQVTNARLYDETVDHVVEQHPEIPIVLPSIVTAVHTAIALPTHVEHDPTRPSAFTFVDAGSTNAAGDPLRVPVKVVDATDGLVKTFYFASTEKEEHIIWRRGET